MLYLLATLYLAFMAKHSYPLLDNPNQSIGQLSIACNSTNKTGVLHLAIYNDPERFPNEGEHYVFQKVNCEDSKNAPIQISGIPFGEYAVAVFQDLNDNNKLDRNLWGIPTEPYGFSKNPKAKWQKPSFKDAAFTLNANQVNLDIKISAWKNR